MSISYNNNIPAAPNNPSNDQPLMRDNTNAINSILDIDHITFNSGAGENSGQHRQVVFNKTSVGANVPGVQSGVNSALYTDAGAADATKPQLYWRNSNDIFPISALRAFVTFTTTAANPVTIITSFNITSVTFSGGAVYVVTVDPTAITGTGVCILTSNSSNNSSYSYAFANPANNPTLTFSNLGGGFQMSVAFLQV